MHHQRVFGTSRHTVASAMVSNGATFKEVAETKAPDRGLITYCRRPKPYILSEAEIERLIASARACGPPDSLRARTRFQQSSARWRPQASGSGSNSAQERRRSVWTNCPPHLIVPETKFHKSRIVPLHATVAEMLRRYSEERRRLQYDALSKAFFVSEQRRYLNHNTLWRWFTSSGCGPLQGGGRA